MTTDPALSGQLAHLADRFSGRLGLAARNLLTDETVFVDADSSYATGSVIKLAILVELFRRASTGAFDLGARFELPDDDSVWCGGSGILKDLSPGIAPTFRDLAVLMIALSDNTATNILIDALAGPAAITETMRSLGFPTIKLYNRADIRLIGDDIHKLGEGSPRDLALLMERLARRRLVDRRSSEAMIEIMRRQQYLDQVPRYFWLKPYAREFGESPGPISVAAKTGFYYGLRTEAGILFFEDVPAIAYAVMTEGGADHTFSPEAEGAVVNGLVGLTMLEHWWPEALGDRPVLDTPYARAIPGRDLRDASGKP